MDYRAGNAVKRFHTVNLLVEETVGHHSANVAMLCNLLTNYQPSANLLKAALYHDLAEQFTGDVPATAKWMYPGLKKVLAIIEQDQLPDIVLTEDEERILKQADMLDLCYKAAEEMAMGNKGMRRIFLNGIHWLQTNQPSLEVLNRVKELLDECEQ